MIVGDERLDTEHAIEVRSPFDERLLGTVPKASSAHIDQAVEIAKSTLKGGSIPTHERAAILDRLAESLTNRAEEFAQLLSSEAAKPIMLARAEVSRAVDTARFSAAVARTMNSELITMDASSAGVGKTGWVRGFLLGLWGRSPLSISH